MKILAIETATEACSAALLIDGEVAERHEIAPRDHSKLILGMAEALLAEAGLRLGAVDAIAFGRGPGSFTGVRIGAGVVQGMAFAQDKPVVPISTLAALAYGAMRTQGAQHVLAAIDARMQEVYWGAFRADDQFGVEGLQEERVCAPEAVNLPAGAGTWWGVGTGWGTYGTILRARTGDIVASTLEDALPRAGDVARLAAYAYPAGQWVGASEAIPVYLRNQVAQKPKTKA